VIEKQHFFSVNTHVPALSTSVFVLVQVHSYLYPHRNQRFLVRHHQGACRRLSAGLCRIVAQQFGHTESTRMLLERGAMIDNQDVFDQTALHCAAQFGQTKVVRLLLKRGADPHMRDEDGRTPSESES
jgi:hypothetical protein